MHYGGSAAGTGRAAGTAGTADTVAGLVNTIDFGGPPLSEHGVPGGHTLGRGSNDQNGRNSKGSSKRDFSRRVLRAVGISSKLKEFQGILEM